MNYKPKCIEFDFEVTEDILERFYSKVNKEGSVVLEKLGRCWEWTAYLDRDGYGQISIGGRTIRAHRFSKHIHAGDMPNGFVTDHLCKNRKCVNPDHLDVVTSEENVKRGDSPSGLNGTKTHCKRGHLFTENNTRPKKMKNGEYGRACKDCEVEFKKEFKVNERKDKPTKEVLEDLLKIHNMVEIARMYGVPHQYIPRWIKSYNITHSRVRTK